MDIQKKIKTLLLKIILKLPLIANLHKKFNLKLVTRNEICFQNYIKFTKNPKTKILILNNFTIRQNYYFKKKSPEMRFVFKIILNLQKIQNKQKY